MSIAEDIASRVKSTKAEPASGDVEATTKEGDHGKRILAAIKQNDATALETAIRDCVDSTDY